MNPVQHILIWMVRLYRWTLSPAKTFLFGPFGQCRFTPSCSQYALDALRTHGALGGSWLAVKRICRCHPWGDCGHDPVPAEAGARGQGSGECLEHHASRTTPHAPRLTPHGARVRSEIDASLIKPAAANR